jgi:hypothetical protein
MELILEEITYKFDDILGLYAQSKSTKRIINIFSKRGIVLQSSSMDYKEGDGRGL